MGSGSIMRDKTTDRLPLEDLKNSNPVEVAECANAMKIDNEVAINW